VKTYVLDASAVFTFLQKNLAAYKINALLKEANHGQADILMSAVNYGEVYSAILRKQGHDHALAIMNAIRPLPIRLIDVTPQRACGAADIKAAYKLYYVDSFAAALALEYKATLVTSDSDFRRLGHGFPVLWLKN
jgi:predicted nucleic acid-binding protein